MNLSTHSHAILAWTVAVIVFVAVGLFYIFYGSNIEPSGSVEYGVESGTPADEAEALEHELQAIQTDGLDVELMDIEKELAQ